MSSELNRKLKEFLKLFLPSLFVIVFIVYGFVSMLENEYVHNIKRNEYHLLNNEKKDSEFNLIENSTNAVILSKMILAHRTQVESNSNLDLITEEFKGFADEKRAYDQVRYLNKSRMEIIRINKNDDHYRIVAVDELQDKSSRYYFIEGLEAKDKIYVWKCDLNVENNSIEFPYKPIIRIAHSVIDDDGKVVGLVVLNLPGSNILNHLEHSSKQAEGNIILINDKGYWLKGLDADKEWVFMFNKPGYKFSADFQEEWKVISSNAEGQILTDNGLITFTTILDKNNSPVVGGEKDRLSAKKSLKLISIANNSVKTPSWWGVAAYSFGIFLIFFIIVIELDRGRKFSYELVFKNQTELI